MVYDWSLWGSVIALGIIALFIQSLRKPQRMFNKKIEHIHVRTVKRF